MKVVGVVFANFVTGPSGNRSRLNAPLGSRTILAHTLRRLIQVEGLAGRSLFVAPRDQEAAQTALRGAGLEAQIELVAKDTAPRLRKTLLTTARKWNLQSWRGGLLGTTWFDEFVDPEAAALALNHYKCDALLCLDGHQPLLDPAIATGMVAHLASHARQASFVFTQAPPGLAGIILTRQALEELLNLNIPVGLLLSYRPELSQADPINRPPCFQLPTPVIQTAGRFTGDTKRSLELLELGVRELGEEVDATTLCRWASQLRNTCTEPLPVEVELELTTAQSLPLATLRPSPDQIPARELSDLDALRNRASELAAYDDRLVFLAGHGDPLLHPRFGEVCALLRSVGVYGIGVETPLVNFTNDRMAALFDNRIDVLEVRIDADTATTYELVHRSDAFERVVANVDRLEQARRQRQIPQPLIVCSLTRCERTLSELESFYDRWIQKVGSAVIRGYNDYCGRLPPDNLLPSTPDVRQPCRRLTSRLTLLADGTVALCHQDYRGELRLGNWREQSLREIWNGPRLGEVRRRHEEGRLEPLPACGRCTEWSRP